MCGFLPAGEPLPLVNRYIQDTADAALRRAVPAGLTPPEQVQAVYRYLVTTVSFGEPLGLDIWRYRGDPMEKPGYVENRALSPLLFGVGSCEDYAAALVVLLQRLGIPAQYVGGLTLSVDGVFVDHAWAAVRLDDKWYHLDPQLERNVLRGGKLTYRFFLKSDAAFLADHRWGKNLAAYYGNPGNENERIVLENFTPPPCREDYPALSAEHVSLSPQPKVGAILSSLAQERRTYAEERGALPALELDIAPPPVILVP